jgi:hypothetical protein
MSRPIAFRIVRIDRVFRRDARALRNEPPSKITSLFSVDHLDRDLFDRISDGRMASRWIEDVGRLMTFSAAHRAKLHSTNPI